MENPPCTTTILSLQKCTPQHLQKKKNEIEKDEKTGISARNFEPIQHLSTPKTAIGIDSKKREGWNGGTDNIWNG